MADVQIAVIDPEDTQLALAAPAEAVVNVAVPGVQGPIGLTGSVTIAQAGTAATPGIRFESDTNTGIYSPGADQLAVATNGAGRLFVNASGNVGVGLASPRVRFDCRTTTTNATWTPNVATSAIFEDNGASTGRCFVTIAGTSAGQTELWFADEDVQTIGRVRYDHTTDAMSLWTNNTEKLRITSAGLVGIGTSSPQALLDVTGGPVLTKNIAYGANQNAAYLVAGTTSYTGATTNFGTYGFQHRFKVDGSGVPRITVDSRTGELFCIADAGNVGIGTTSPSFLLDVAGSARLGAATGDVSFEVGSGASANRNALIDFVGDTTYTDYGLRIIRTSSGANADSKIQHRGTGSLIIEAQEAAPITFLNGSTERARIDSSGRLLVGTSTTIPAKGYQADFTTAIDSRFQIAGNTVVNGSASISCFQNFGGANPLLALCKSNSGTVGTFSATLASGDSLGVFAFNGDDGSKFVTGAAIEVEVDGTPGTNDMPGCLVFSTTADGASSPTERLRITSAGVLQIADAGNITVGTTTGTKIGTATTQKLGFYNATPVVQPAAVADATDAASVIARLNDLLARLRTLGIIAT